MGQTNPRYPVRELALSLEDCAAHTNGTKERKLAGDIIACRTPGSAIGRKEAHAYLWLRVEGLEENEMARLTDVVEDGSAVFDKRRYCIPLDRLAQVVPGFDVSLAMNPAVVYQSFLAVDEESYQFLADTPPLEVEGLVFDKATGDFL